MKKFVIYFFLLSVPVILLSQKSFPIAVKAALAKVGSNKAELVKAINYFQKKNDSLQLKALYFLLVNMDSHQSVNYYWADNTGKRIAFNELDYPDLPSSIKAFDALKAKTNQIHPLPIIYKDADTITATFLIDNVERAFVAWKQPWAKRLSFSDFCDYLLPYRASVEPLQNWRGTYAKQFAGLNQKVTNKTIDEALNFFASDYRSWFVNTNGLETRKEPLPRLGALQLLHRKKGPCEDIADLEVFRLRSQGIASTVDVVPFWATSMGSHFLNAVIQPQKVWHYDAFNSTPVTNYKFMREPGKVLRTTYAKQTAALANIEAIDNIPKGLLRSLNYKDVTPEYWPTQNVSASLFNIANPQKVVYACVFNFFNWQPVWWASIKNNTGLFTKMGKGAIYLPMYYLQGKLKPAGYPVAVGYKQIQVLMPDTLHTHTVHLTEQDKYLYYKPGKKYKLFYWNSGWRALAVQIANTNTKEMVFYKVPTNALLVLVPETSEHKERPFTITDTGERVWW